ncbi:MAG: hypothetical protein IJ730_05880 [Alphaproteobacteria bacterium]|nr:hypothetical protein [Alphaproteobacteria bacterium]
MNETDYRVYANKRISRVMKEVKYDAREYPPHDGNADFLKAHGGIEAYFSTTKRLFSELVELVANIHKDDRNKLIGDKLTEIEKHADEADENVSPLIERDILLATWGLLDTKNEYGLFVDPKSEYVKEHVDQYKDMCRETESESVNKKDE